MNTKMRLVGALVVLFGLWACAAAPTSTPAAEARRPANLPVQPADKPGIKYDAKTGEIHKGFMDRHELLVKTARAGNIDVYFEGDSITQGWGGPGRQVWAEKFAPLKAANFGIGGDRTQHVLWRLENGELDGVNPKAVVILIGTNNLRSEPEEIASGIKAIVNVFRTRTPQARILLMGLFPRAEKPDDWARAKVKAVNQIISKLDDGSHVTYMDIGEKFLSADGTLSKEIMPDFLHPSAKGYEIWADAILPTVNKMLAGSN